MATCGTERLTPEECTGDVDHRVIRQSDMATHLDQPVFLISHGGVASEELTRRLKISYSRQKIGPRPRPFKGAFVHAPFPPETAVGTGVYLFGDLFNAIVSQVRRHPDNSKKMRNDERHPDIATVADLALPGDDDPMGIRAQFEAFLAARPPYPLIFVRRERLAAAQDVLSRILDRPALDWHDRPRSSDWTTLAPGEQDLLQKKYGKLQDTMTEMPAIAVSVPPETLTQTDGISSASVRESEAYVHLLEPTCAALAAARPDLHDPYRVSRLKHAMMLSDGRVAVNLRQDILKSNNKPLHSTGTLVVFDEASVRAAQVVQHPKVGFPEGARHAGFEDPRLIRTGKGDQIVVNGLIAPGERRIFLYDVAEDRCREVTVEGLTQNRIEKNWVPFVVDGTLHFLYAINPLVVLRQSGPLGDTAHFEILHKATRESFVRADFPWGGTPLLPWMGSMYVGFAHSRKPWRAVPMMLDVESWRVALGGPVDLPRPDGCEAWRGKDVQYPYDLRMSEGDPELFVEFEDRHPTRLALDVMCVSKEFSRLRARLEA